MQIAPAASRMQREGWVQGIVFSLAFHRPDFESYTEGALIDRVMRARRELDVSQE